MTVTVALQLPNVNSSMLPLTVSVELPALVVLPFTVDVVHVMFAKPALRSRLDSAEASITVPAGQVIVLAPLVHVSVVAEAELAPTNAITAAAATTARPSIFRYFISFSLSRRRSAIFLLSP